MKKERTKNKKDVCGKCEKEFFHYSWDNQKYCSQGCYFGYIRSLRTKHICASCGNQILTTKYRHTRNEEYYCCRDCYNSRRSENIKNIKRGTKFFKELLKVAICECGEKRTYLLEIHHADGDDSNNKLSNLEIVCSNCHMRRHLKFTNDCWVYHPKSLTPREILNKL